MKEFWIDRKNFIGIELIFLAILITCYLIYVNHLSYIIGIVIGYITAFVVVSMMANRLWRASFVSVKKAKRQMYVGMIMRLLTIFIIMMIVARESQLLFYIAILSFLFAFFIIIFNLIIFVYHLNMK